MFKFLKKKETPVEDPLVKLDELKWIKEVLLDYNLLDIKTLLNMTEIQTKKQSQESLKFILNLLQPELIKKINSGQTYVKLAISKEEYELHTRPLYSIRGQLESLGIQIVLDIDNYYNINSDTPLRYSAAIYLKSPKKDAK